MKTKTSDAVELFLQGKIKESLRIASTFRLGLSKQEQSVLKGGYEAFNHAGFYRQLGKNPEKMIADAVDLFSTKIAKTA